MIEDKIKQEYEWQHSEIGEPTLDELFSKINEALGIELWIWQKTYMTMATFTEAVFTAAGNMCNALAQAFSRQAQAFNAVADQYKDDKAGVIHGE